MNIRTAKWAFASSSRNVPNELRVGQFVKCLVQVSEYDRVGDTGIIIAFNINCVEIAWDNPTEPAITRYLNRTPYAHSYFINYIAHATFDMKTEWEKDFEFA